MTRKSLHYREVYKIYFERLQKEGDFIWSRFKLYMTIKSAALAAIVIILRDSDLDSNFNILTRMPLVAIVSFLGFRVALEWSRINEEGRYWENVFTHFLARIERRINSKDVNLFRFIDDHERPKWRGKRVPKSGAEHVTEQSVQRKDPIFSNITVARLFQYVFFTLFLLSLVAAGYAAIAEFLAAPIPAPHT